MSLPSEIEILHSWGHLSPKIRPMDTGRRTPAGHRIINDPNTSECIEFPFNSGFLVGKLIYPAMLEQQTNGADKMAGLADAAEAEVL